MEALRYYRTTQLSSDYVLEYFILGTKDIFSKNLIGGNINERNV